MSSLTDQPESGLSDREIRSGLRRVDDLAAGGTITLPAWEADFVTAMVWRMCRRLTPRQRRSALLIVERYLGSL